MNRSDGMPMQQVELLIHLLHETQEELQHHIHLVREYQSRLQEITLERDATRIAPQSSMGVLARLTDWAGLTRNKDVLELRASGLFDATWYIQQYPDVARDGMDPAKHYLKFGAREGRNPGPRFDTRWYLTTYADVAEKGMNPLLHYARHGKAEGRLPSPEGLRQADPFALERRWLQQARDEKAAEVQVLRERLEALEQEKTTLLADNKDLIAHWHTAQEELEQQIDRNTALTEEKDDLAQRLEQYAQRLEQQQAEIGRLQGERVAQARAADELRGELDSVRAELDRQRQAQAEVQARLEHALAQLQARESDLAVARTQLAGQHAQLERHRWQAEQEQQRVTDSFRLIKQMLLDEAA